VPLEGMDEGAVPSEDRQQGFIGRLFRRLRETDEERLAAETREWAGTVQGCTTIADAPTRKRARIAAVVRRITVRPAEGHEAVEAVLSDGTGEIAAVWMGRRSIPGMSLGTRMVLEGVLGDATRGEPRRMVNPRFEFAAADTVERR
jgi:hypothetical protein